MRPNLFLATIGRGSNGSNALEVTEDRAAVTAESQDNIINRVNNISQYGPSWHYVPGIGVAGTAYAEVPGSALGDLAFTRASSKTRTNAAGVVETIASNVPPHDYRNADGTLSTFPRLNLEPQRTNSIRNSSMVGAVAGTPGTLPTNWNASNAALTQSIIAIGTESGLPFVDIRLSGVASGNNHRIDFDSLTQIAASNGQTWSESFWYKRIATPTGPVAENSVIVQRTAAGAFITSTTVAFTGTSNLQRVVQAATLAGGATVGVVVPGISFTLVGGSTYDFTIRIAAPQMELGAYASTWVPTTTAAVTRLADVVTETNIFSNSFFSASGGTWFVSLANTEPQNRTASVGFNLVASNANIEIRLASTALVRPTINVIQSGVVVGYLLTTNESRIAIRWTGSNTDIWVNGAKVSITAAMTATQFQTLTMQGTANRFSVNETAFFSRPLTDAQLAQLTTL